MFQKGIEIIFSDGSPSDFSNNLSICRDNSTNLMYACFAHINQANTLQWDANADYASNGSIFLQAKPVGNSSTVIQAKLCTPTSQTSPYLAIATTSGAMIYNPTTEAVMAWFPLNVLESCLGTSNGQIILFDCSKANSVTFKKVIAEHNSAIVDIASNNVEKLCCSCDTSGNIVVWGKYFRSIQRKIATKLSYSCMNFHGRKIIVGTYTGKILVFCSDTGTLLADINAHIRQINAVTCSGDCSKVIVVGYTTVISISEDSILRIWRFDDENKPDVCKVTCLHSERLENKALVGAQFLDDTGTAFVIAAYDYSKLSFYEISKQSDETINI
uniref:WD_REPEATS_REGION domain-containing protein n=1 Tax=Syphacia muris TaxID=451379 RepID=A0A0N5ARR7_9BILA